MPSVPTRSETYLRLMNSIRECQDAAAVMSHLHNTEDTLKDKALARGWLAVSEMFKIIQGRIIELAQGKLLS
jgi:hypothetical protein